MHPERRDVGIGPLHLGGELRLGASAAVDEEPLAARRKQPHRFAGQILGIGLAALCREGGEAEPYAPLFAHGIGTRLPHGGRRVREVEAQAPNHVAVAQNGVAKRSSAALAAALHAHPFGQTPLADVGHAYAVQPHREAEGLRTQHAVDIGHGIDPQAPRTGGQAPHAPQRVLGPLGVDIQEVDVEPLEEGAEEGPRRHGHLHVGTGRLEGPQRMGQHRHVAHGRGAQHQQVARPLTSCHRARG